MEVIIKVGIIAILGVLAALWLKGTKPEFAVCIGITLGMFIFGYTVRQLQTMLNGLGQLRELFEGSKGYLAILIKVIGMLSLIMIAMNNTFYKLDMNVMVLLPLLVLSLPIVFYNDSKLYNITDALYNLGIVYFLGFSFGNIIYMGDNDLIKCIFIFIIAFITDTYAYIGGCLIGRHKLTSISPKKTIEGSVIGTIMGTLIGSVYYYNLVGGVTIFETVVLCLVLTLLSEVGDLFFSSIKRYFDKKDYSNLIPGHGGILDRFDSVIYVSLGLSLILSII